MQMYDKKYESKKLPTIPENAEINIQTLLDKSAPYDGYESDTAHTIYTPEIYAQIIDGDDILDDSEALWERRRRIHRGEESPLSFEDYKHQLPKHSDIVASLNNLGITDDTLKSYSINKELSNGKKTEIKIKPGAAQTGAAQTGAAQTGAAQTGAAQTGATQTGATQTGAAQTGAAQTGAAQTGAAQTGATQTGATQTGAAQTGATQTGATQTGATQTGATQTGATQTGATQTEPLPTPINSLHKYSVKDRDKILRNIFNQAVNNVNLQNKGVTQSKEIIQQLINIEADRLLNIWLYSNK